MFGRWWEQNMIFDTHAHYDDEAFDGDRDALLASMREQGVTGIVNMGAALQGERDSVALSERWPFLYAGVGIHPDEVGCLNDEVMEELRKNCAREKTVAVGEIGLDYYWMKESKETQQRWFAAQLALAKEVDLPVNIHSREAAQDTFDIIRREHAGSTGGIIHCFSGSAEMAKEYVKMGYYLGIGGVVTFKNSRVLKQVVKEIPLERLVTETDSPYLAPAPFRGKRNCSANISYVIDEIARIKELDRAETEAVLYSNAREVYRLNTLWSV